MNWIKVDDKKPDYGESVLVVIKFKNHDARIIHIGVLCCLNGWKLDYSHGITLSYEITHWRSLPNFPEDK